jgi:predicted ArsR family transcriptional regulator
MDQDLIELFGNRDMDPSAKSIKEISEQVGMSEGQVLKKMKLAVNSGLWEQVFKMNDKGRAVLAYRKKA